MAKNVLELNGKRYDAITGAYLGVSSAAPAAMPGKKAAAHPAKKSGRVIDGFIRSNGKTAAAALPAKPRAAARKTTEIATVTTPPKPVKKPAVHAQAHQPQKAKTLMRRAVHKPQAAMKPAIKTQAPAEIAPKPASALAIKPSAHTIDEERLERAHTVHKSKGIRHFQPVRPDFTPAAIEETPRPDNHVVPVIAVTPAPPTIKPAARQHDDIFEAALARAESHKQPAHPHKSRRRHSRLTNALAGIAALLVIGGFIGYLNLPNIQLHVASVRAGFSADMPAYKPDGYALKGGVQRVGNTVSMRFAAGENSYTVTQQPSSWNSQTLIDNTIALSDGTYKTVQAGGRNVYVYGGSNAVWVDRGVRYDLTANTPLSTDDITRLAASL